MRKVKSQYEIEQIRHTCKIADEAMDYMLSNAKKGSNILEMIGIAERVQKNYYKKKVLIHLLVIY